MTCYSLDGVAPKIHPTAYVHPDAVLIGDVTIGEDASVWPNAVLRADFGSIRVGKRTSIQDGTVLHTTEEWPTVIGDDCVVGHNTHLEGCTVEDRCLIGSGSVTLNRAVIGTGGVVGAQALITEDFEVPPGGVALGVPAKIVRITEGGTPWIDYGVGEYQSARRRYPGGLAEVSLDECRTETP
ncbi:gamma carbonic anhydrase family protein [Gordonia phthalatica]|uniref:gamma carbonic anhydrase family protein n=1 Tax=Gordonia phthalatica TaxID=1136941 RepID=UPI0009EC6F78|nr:gamma carbonic anhydrase family protein [Gordonia phthalatica]